MEGLIDKRILKFAPGARRWIALTFLSGLMGSIANIALLFLAGRIIVGIYDGRTLLSMLDLFSGMLAAIGLRAIAEASRDITAQRSAAMVKSSVRKRINQHLLDLGPSFVEMRNTSALATTVLDGVEALEAYVGLYVPYMALCLVMPVLLFLGFAIYVDLISALMLMAFVPLVPLSLLIFITDNSPFFPRNLVCTICGIVIIYVNHRLRKCFSHITDNLGYSLTFVIARYQNCYFIWHLYFFSPVKLLCFLTDPLTVARVLFLVNSPGGFFLFIVQEAYL